MKFQDVPFENKRLLIKFNLVVFCALAFFVLCGISNSPTSVYAQNTEIEKQLNPKTGTKTIKTHPPKKTVNDAPRIKPRLPYIRKVRTGNPPTGVRVEARQQVTFKTGAAAVEIWSDGKQLGISDQTGKLPTSLKAGEHLITARKYNQDLFASTKIAVSSELNDFDFSGDVAKGLDEIRQTQPLEPEITAKEIKTVDVDTIFKNYRDPQTKESVTSKDWQAVYDQSRQQSTIGSSDNKIEAICDFAQGQIELSLGNRQKAITLFNSAVSFLPNSPILHYGLGMAQLSAGNTADATSSFTKTIQLDNKFSLAYKELGKIYLSQNRTQEAAGYYQQAQASGDNTPDLRLQIAETQIKNKNCPAAVKELEILQTELPTANGLMALGSCYIEQKRSLSAIEVLNKAIQIEPNSAMPQYRIGLIYLKQKEFGKAQESFEQALKLDAEGKTINRKELQGLIEKAKKRAK